jgi:hypothetical protein
MGHVVNPVSYRLYNTRYWNYIWFSKNNFSYFLNSDIIFSRFIKIFLYNILRLDKVGLIFINFKIVRNFNLLNFYLFVHDSFLDMLYIDLNKVFNFKVFKKNFQKKIFRKLSFYPKFYKTSKYSSHKLISYIKKNFLNKVSYYFFINFFKEKLIKRYWEQFKGLFMFFLTQFRYSFNTTPNLFIMGTSKLNINASVISEFFYVRLKQYYTIWEILKNINFLFKILRFKYRFIKGYKIMCSGRFSRKQRATYSWKTFGSIAPSSMKSRLDYKHSSISLKYSLCTIKVWVRMKRHKSRYDFVL